MKKHIIIVASAIFLFLGCSSWLDVKPTDRISEEVTFSTVQGFQTALNGVYIELNQSSVYGKYLTYHFVEILGRRYAINSESGDLYKMINENNYKTETVKSITKQIWTKTYSLISNINFILKNCETNRAVLDDENYKIIKGEALALRAMLHFDMLRLFGPIPKDSTKISVPYYKEFTYSKNPRESLEVVMQKVMDDLQNSADILKEVDPIVKVGINNNNDKNFLNFRTLRMNYYAVKALQARVFLYRNKKAEALEAAKEVIAVQEAYFPFVTAASIAESSDNPDRTFSSEALFCLQTTNRKSIDTPAEGASLYSLYTNDASLNKIYNDQQSDYRLKAWFKDLKVFSGKNYYLLNKFRVGANSNLLLNQVVPLIRVSEMYYIAAECEPVVKTGLTYLNKIKTNRGVPTVSTSSAITLKTYIDTEYACEFWGEGQLFYHYKRNAKTSSIFSPYDRGSLSMTLSAYVIPIPDGEIDYN